MAGAVNLIIASLRTFFFKPQIVYYCCQCIAGLSHHNVVNSELFDDCDVSELLFKTLNMYMEQGEVVEAVCHAIYALKDLNHRLGDLCKVHTITIIITIIINTTINLLFLIILIISYNHPISLLLSCIHHCSWWWMHCAYTPNP